MSLLNTVMVYFLRRGGSFAYFDDQTKAGIKVTKWPLLNNVYKSNNLLVLGHLSTFIHNLIEVNFEIVKHPTIQNL